MRALLLCVLALSACGPVPWNDSAWALIEDTPSTCVYARREVDGGGISYTLFARYSAADVKGTDRSGHPGPCPRNRASISMVNGADISTTTTTVTP